MENIYIILKIGTKFYHNNVLTHQQDKKGRFRIGMEN